MLIACVRRCAKAGATFGRHRQAYAERRPVVESLQRTAQTSLDGGSSTARRFVDCEPWQFGFSLLTRSLRLTHENLRQRDPNFIAEVNDHVAAQAEHQTGGQSAAASVAAPDVYAASVRDPIIPTASRCRRCVSTGGRRHAERMAPLAHYGSRAIGGAGLVISEMTDVCREGRDTPAAQVFTNRNMCRRGDGSSTLSHKHSEAKMAFSLRMRDAKRRRVCRGAEDEPLPEQESWPIVGPVGDCSGMNAARFRVK